MKTVRCPQCNLVCWNTVLNCNRCGFDIQSIIVEEPQAEFEHVGSFEQNVNEQFAQNPTVFSGQNSRHFSENQNGYQSQNQNDFDGHRDFEGNESRNPYQNYRSDNNRNYGNQNRFQQYPNKTKKGLAIASMVMGIVGFPPVGFLVGGLLAAVLGTIFGMAGFVLGFGFTIFIPLTALISGIVALRRTNKNPQEFGGKGFSIAGICCGGFVLIFLPIIGAIAIPNLLAARRAANEGSAISSMRKIAEAEANLRETNGKACADLTVLGSNQLIDTVLAKGEKSGYRFIISKLPTVENDCAITATPISDSTGTRAFYFSTEDGEIRARKYVGLLADMNDEPIE